MKKKREVGLLAWGVAMLVLVCAGTLAAQDKPADSMQIVLEKIRADKKLLVSENMQLSEAEAKAFWPVYERYQDELFVLRARTAKLIKEYGEAYQNMTNESAKRLLDESITIEGLGVKLRKAYLPKFRKALRDIKVARYFQIENKIHAVLMYELAGNIPLVKASGQ